jgi:MFS family permease
VAGRVRRVAVVSRNKVLRRFWLSQMVSEIGDWIGLLGVAALLYERTGQAVMAAASLAALYLPYLFSPWLVGWTARIPPRTLLIGADVLRAGLILLLLLPLPPWALLGLAFLASIPTSVYEATRAAAVPEYAPDEDTREDALVLFQSTQQAANMIGFLLGGAALALMGFTAAIGLNALSFLLSGLLLLGVPGIAPFSDPSETARGLLRAGIRALRRQTLLRRAVVLSVVSASTIMAGEALVIVYASEIGHPGLAGPFAALTAFVAATVGLVMPRHSSSADLMRVAAGAMLVGSAIAVFGFLLAPATGTGLIAYFGLGIVSAPGALTYVVAVREMRAAVRGPVFALVQVAMMGGQAAVAVLAGHLADRTTVGTAVALWQVPTLLLATWVLVGMLVVAGWRRRRPSAATPVRVVPPPAPTFPPRPTPSPAPAASPAAGAPGTPGLPSTPQGQ